MEVRVGALEPWRDGDLDWAAGPILAHHVKRDCECSREGILGGIVHVY